MEENPKWLKWAKRIQSISQTGLAYASDKIDKQRYEELRALSVEILNQYTEIGEVRARDIFANETGYQTPKIDVRAAVFSEEKILLVQEQHDMKWCMPGGWIDIDASLKQATIRGRNGMQAEKDRFGI